MQTAYVLTSILLQKRFGSLLQAKTLALMVNTILTQFLH